MVPLHRFERVIVFPFGGAKAGVEAGPAALNAHLLGSGFAKWQLPDRYEVIDAIPRTSTGKFWKVKLRERFPA